VGQQALSEATCHNMLLTALSAQSPHRLGEGCLPDGSCNITPRLCLPSCRCIVLSLQRAKQLSVALLCSCFLTFTRGGRLHMQVQLTQS
jgi:hypothetical protein